MRKRMMLALLLVMAATGPASAQDQDAAASGPRLRTA